MLLGSKKVPVPKVCINGREIEKVSTFKYLGFTLDNKLTHRRHIDGLISKLRKYRHVSYRIKKYLSIKSAKAFYNGIIFSILNYGLLIWGGIIDTAKFIKLQNLQDRIIFNLFSTPADSKPQVCKIYQRIEILRVTDLYKLRASLSIYKILNCGYLPSMYNQLVELQFQHNYQTRNRRNFRRQIPKIQAIKFNLLYKALKYYNETDAAIRNAANAGTFERLLKNQLISLY